MKDTRSIWDKIYYDYIYNIRHLHQHIIKGIKNLIYWFPIIWKDRDFDEHYIFTILSAKIEKQAKHIKKNGYHVRADRDAEIMMTCVRLMNKTSENFYSHESTEYHKSKMEFIPIEGRRGSRVEFTEISNNYDDYFKKYPLIYKKALAQQTAKKPKKRDIALDMATINQARANRLLFKILEENINLWWD